MFKIAISKVIFNGDTLMDVTGDNPESSNMLMGTRATANNGESVDGALVTAEASDSNPEMDGMASPGVAEEYSRGDHVHPSDTSKVSTSTTINGKALSSNITLTASDVGALPDNTDIPEKTSDLTNDSNFVSDANYVHTDNNFTDTLEAKLNGIAEGATVDDHKWNNVELNKTVFTDDSDYYIPSLVGTSATSAGLLRVNQQAISRSIPRRTSDGFILSTTPTAGDSSTKVATTSFVGSAISTAISGVNSFEYEVVQSLPTTNIKDHTIYLVAKTGSTGDVYDEYLYINNAWEHIGSTDVDLSGYVPTTRTVNNKALSSDITLTASDVGALPDSTVIPAQTAKIWTGTCGTTSDTATKVVTLDDATGFSLTAGVRIAVTFEYGVYDNSNVINLNVNETGAEGVVVSLDTGGQALGNVTISWGRRDTVFFTYDGSYWKFEGSSLLQYKTYVLASNAVPKTRTVNGKALSSNITLTASDVSALPSNTTYVSSVNGNSGAVTIADSDEKVKQTPLNGMNSGKGVLFSSGTGGNEETSTVYTSNKLMWNDYSTPTLTIYNSDRTKEGELAYNHLYLGDSNSSYKSYLLTASLTANRQHNLPDKGGTIALISDIPSASDLLPSQTEQSGKYLTTNGTTASWSEIDLSTKQDKYTITTATISASGWSNAVYSALQTTYPAASYDLDIELNGDLVTTAQHEAWSNAQIVGSTTGNTIRALGTVPTIDIPVILKVTAK